MHLQLLYFGFYGINFLEGDFVFAGLRIELPDVLLTCEFV